MKVEAFEVVGDSPAAMAYRGLVKMHAAELVQRATFKRSGRISATDAHRIAMDLAKLSTKHELDDTIELVLARADQLDLERETQA